MSFILRSSSYLKKAKRRSFEVQPLKLHPDPIDQHQFIYEPDHLTSLTANWNNASSSLGRLSQLGGAEGIALALRSDLQCGLLEDETTSQNFSRRQKIYGRNVFRKKPLRNFFLFCLDEFHDPFLVILALAGFAYTIFGAVHQPEEAGYIEGLAILAAVLFVVLTAAGNNYATERRFRSLNERSHVTQVLAFRGGKEVILPSSDVMVGDLVALSMGSAIPCDGILVSCTDDLQCEESGLTGESEAVVKSEAHPFLLAGTQVVNGEGLMLVTSVGERTCWGAMMIGLQSKRERTPLQKKLDRLVKLIGIVGAVFASITFIVKLVYWILANNVKKTYLDDITSIIFSLLTSVSLIVVAIPEGLPLAVTITLAYAMRKMMKDNNFVRVLSACETMGNVTTICSDKTGTLTRNSMTVVEAWPDVFIRGKEENLEFSEEKPHRSFVEAIVHGVALNSKIFITNRDDWNDPSVPEYAGGNKTECAIFSWAVNLGLDEKKVRKNFPVEKAYPFNSSMKRSSVLVSTKNGFRMYLKGAAEKVLDSFCTKLLHPSGEHSELSGENKQSIALVIEEMVSRGLRCICLAYKDYDKIDYDQEGTPVDPEMTDFTLLAIVALKDPLRSDVKDAVRRCQESGIIVRMVTGDHPKTAAFIAAECGILSPERKDHLVVTGDEFQKMSQDRLQIVLPMLRVMARSTPQDKEKLVRLYMDLNHTVAVTGDGANDALALKSANVGLSMGIQGTDVAKEASDIVILDDSFSSIVKTVKWGRAVYDNIRKFVQFQLTINIVALSLSFIGAAINSDNKKNFPLSFTPLQLLWMNIIMDSGAALIFSTEEPTETLLQRKPYRKDSMLISPTMWKHIAGHALIQIVILLVIVLPLDNPIGMDLFFIGGENQTLQLKTCVFNTFVWFQIFNSINSRKINDELNVFQNIFSNVIYPMVLLGFTVGQILIITFLGQVASVTRLSVIQWTVCILLGSISMPVGFMLRFIAIKREYGFIESSVVDRDNLEQKIFVK